MVEFVVYRQSGARRKQGEVLGNKFLSTSAELTPSFVVRCFDNENIVHVEGSVDPARDIETINLELILADIEHLERRLKRTRKAAKADKKLLRDVEILESLKAHLEEGKTARTFEGALAEDEDIDRVIGESDLLSAKKVIYAANMDEEGFTGNDTENERLKAVQAIADAEGAMVLPICAKLEEDIARYGRRERMFLSELGLHELVWTV